MADILLELPDALQSRLQRQASDVGVSLEDHIRALLVQNAPSHPPWKREAIEPPIADESIVKAAEIEAEYVRLGYSAGWRFITCPERNMRQASVILVSMNPSGDRPHGPAWSQEEGSAYVVEAWDGQAVGADPLQRQIQMMFSLLKVEQSEVFSAHFVPFRSPTWAKLSHQQEALNFGERLWQWLLPRTQAKLIVVLGKGEIGPRVANIAGARFEGSFPIGWGSYTADRYVLPGGGHVVALPHPGRFQVFGRAASKESLNRLFLR